MSTDYASYLNGFVAGYWEGFDYALTGSHDGVGGEVVAEAAPGAADAPTATPELAPGPLPLRGSLPGASSSVPSSLPAIGRMAASTEGVGKDESVHVKRGMIIALKAMEEMFRGDNMWVSASMCQRTHTAMEFSTLRKLT